MNRIDFIDIVYVLGAGTSRTGMRAGLADGRLSPPERGSVWPEGHQVFSGPVAARSSQADVESARGR